MSTNAKAPDWKQAWMLKGSQNGVTPAEPAPWSMVGNKVRNGWEENASVSCGRYRTLDFTPSAVGNRGGFYT